MAHGARFALGLKAAKGEIRPRQFDNSGGFNNKDSDE
jgi:hypothetical protein